jgi:hypothetical protein
VDCGDLAGSQRAVDLARSSTPTVGILGNPSVIRLRHDEPPEPDYSYEICKVSGLDKPRRVPGCPVGCSAYVSLSNWKCVTIIIRILHETGSIDDPTA